MDAASCLPQLTDAIRQGGKIAVTGMGGIGKTEMTRQALAVLAQGLDHMVQVSDDEVAAAMRAIYTDTHNVAEGAGAAALAAALQERPTLRGRCVGVALTGANVDADAFAETLSKK